MSVAGLLPAFLRRSVPAYLMILATSATSPLLAQEVGDSEIVIEQLEPLAGTESGGEVLRDDRFKLAPFTTPGPSGPSVLIESVETTPRDGAQMRQLDKMTGLTRTFELKAGTEMMVDRLIVKLDACRSPAGNARYGTMAFVEIWDTKQTDETPVFSGWMLAESPALSALDHPRYDVWVINCTTPPGETPVASE